MGSAPGLDINLPEYSNFIPKMEQSVDYILRRCTNAVKERYLIGISLSSYHGSNA